MRLDEVEDTFEQQERKERIFEVCLKAIPLVFLLFCICLFCSASSIFRVTNKVHIIGENEYA